MTPEFEQAKRELQRKYARKTYGLDPTTLQREPTGYDINFMIDLTALLEQHKEMMLEPMRKKLLSMRASKEVMDRLDAEDKLMQYGYHDCINEMLMWLKNVKK